MRTELHFLNGRYKISAPHNSVSLNQLIHYHNPQTEDDLEQLINNHVDGECECGAVSKGTLEDYGKRLFQVQFEEWGEPTCSIHECHQFIRDRFLRDTIRGKVREEEVQLYLESKLPSTVFRVGSADWINDVEFRVDLEVFLLDELLCAVQVKPESFKWTVPTRIKNISLDKHKRYGKPVFYLYYNGGGMLNHERVVEYILLWANKYYMDILFKIHQSDETKKRVGVS